MNRFLRLVVFFALVAFIAPTPTIAQQWAEFRSPDGKYRVEFPGKPTVRQQRTERGSSYDVVECSGEKDSYYFTSDIPVGPKHIGQPAPELFDAVRDGQLASTKGKVREEKSLTIAGAAARRVIIDAPGPLVLYVLLILKDERFYQVIYVARAGEENTSDMARFFNSFAVLPN